MACVSGRFLFGSIFVERHVKPIHWGEKPFLIDARDAFKSIDEDNSGQIDVSEFAKLFRRFSTTAQTKIVSVFAEVDIDRSGEITFAEFAEEWDRILRFLKSDIQRNELPICYLLPKQVVTGSNDYASMSAGGSSNSNVTGADKHVTPIMQINPSANRWKIEGRITNISNMKTWSNAKGDCKFAIKDA